jgi:hypothetical protein
MTPRPAPPGSKIEWERTIPRVGHFYIHGAVFRKGWKSYLLRTKIVDMNTSVVCLIMTDGSIRKWYFDWKSREAEIQSVIEGAREFVLAHHVLTS